MPNPAGSDLPNPAQYTDPGDGTVVDEVTGLVWQKSPPDETYSWDESLAYCDGLELGGQSDWRLPTRIELTSIIDWTVGGAKVDSTAFPGAQGAFHKTASDWYISITGDDSRAWAFNLSDGIVSNAFEKDTAARLRCVRGGSLEGEAPSELAVEPPNHYALLSDDEALDNYTGLVWQRRDSDEELSWEQAVAYCDSLTLGGQEWRLPSMRELATLVDEADVAPSINEEVFPDTKWGSRTNNWYWASHRAYNQATAAWAINFDDGFTGFNIGDSGDWNYFTAGYAKCVR